MVGMPHPYISEVPAGAKCFSLYLWDEYFGGAQDDWDWLGSATSDAVQVLDNLDLTANLLDGISWEGGTESCTTDAGGTNEATFLPYAAVEAYELDVSEVCSVPPVSGAYIQTVEGKLNISTNFPDATAYTVRFDVEATNSYNNDSAYKWVNGVPRLLRVSLVMDNVSLEQDIQVKVDGSKETIYMTFLDVPRAGKRNIAGVRFESGEETGSIKITQPQLFAGSAERWIRYFDNGAVALNATHDDWDLELSPSLSTTLAYTRLEGTQEPSINSGGEGAGVTKNRFTIPAEDALFVSRNR